MEQETEMAILERQLDSYPVAMSPSQVAEALGVTRKTVDRLLEIGQLEYFTLDPTAERKQKRVSKAVLIAYMQNSSNSNNQ